MKILIVDDNSDNLRLLRYTVEAHGHEALSAGNGRDGLSMALIHHPDLIISDVLMPVMDGFQLLRSLKRLSSIPLIFYSADYKTSKDIELALSLGAEAYIIKPKEPVELWSEIERIIGAGSTGVTTPEMIDDDSGYLKRYNQVVTAKLEEKVRSLEEALTECKRAEEQIHDKQSRLNAMALELSLAEERERRTIASELHDHIGQNLTLAKIKLGILAKGSWAESDASLIDEATGILDKVIHDVRTLTHRISPPILESGNLEMALKWLGRQTETDYGLTVLFTDDAKEKPLSEEIRSVLYHAVRELLINSAKHSMAETVRIAVGREADHLRIAVEDDGIGFDAADINTDGAVGNGYGLFNIRRRIFHLGGTFEIASSSGNGTRTTIGMPLKGRGSHLQGEPYDYQGSSGR